MLSVRLKLLTPMRMFCAVSSMLCSCVATLHVALVVCGSQTSKGAQEVALTMLACCCRHLWLRPSVPIGHKLVVVLFALGMSIPSQHM